MGNYYDHFTGEQRNLLQRELNAGRTRAEIARQIGCHRSTIGRESPEAEPIALTMRYKEV